MLASWRGTRFECVQVLREVCDHVLKDSDVTETVLINRAKVLFLAYLICGAPLIGVLCLRLGFTCPWSHFQEDTAR